MVSNILIRVVHSLTGKKYLFFLLLAILVVLLFFGVKQLKISESIFDTLPKSSTFTTFQRLISDAKLDSKVVLSLDVPPSVDKNDLYEIVADFENQLEQAAEGRLENIRAFREDVDSDVVDYVLNHLPELIDSSYYRYIDERTAESSIEASVAQSRAKMQTPEGAWTKSLYLKDPLGLSYPFFRELREGAGAMEVSIENEMVLINQGRQVLITAQTSFPSGDSANESGLYSRLQDLQQKWNKAHPEHTLHYFGGFAMAASNASQIKQDAVFTLLLALIIIFGLLWMYYRSLLTSLVILFPALFGGLFALGIIGYTQPSVSGISLATGAVLLGIALDYSIHFVSHFKHTGSVASTLKDISTPLITGSLTTILAYSALIFANSDLLSDFGIFAGLALSSALLFTLIALPVLVNLLKITPDARKSGKPLFSFPEIPAKFSFPVLVALGVVTLIFYRQMDKVSFDGDPRNLSIQTDAMKKAEKLLTPIDPEKDIQLFVFASGDRAAEQNSSIFRSLLKKKEEGLVKSFSSSAPLAAPERLRTDRQLQWNSYWSAGNKSHVVQQKLDLEAANNGFTATAFSDFVRLINGMDERDRSEISSEELIEKMGLDNLVYTHEGKPAYITTVVLDKANVAALKATIGSLDGVQLFYRAEMAESLLEVVKEDFNYILLVSASIVFLALLLFYGRLELALLSFLPMVISWIWILGLMVWLDVKFNFINIVFATFIFGLGDDFSIFMTDGLLQRYRQGRNKLSSYTSAISLSGLTVLIGTGVLFFASHPALRSIAVVSVPGILCIVAVSLVLQPLVFGLFIQNRVDQGRTPISLWTFVKTWASFLFFVFTCYFAFFVMVVLIILPVGKKKKKEWLAWVMSKLSTAVMYSGTQIRKRTFGKQFLDYSKPAILIANHSSFLDTMIMLMHHPKAVIMVKEWVYKSPLYGWVIRYANYLFMEEGPEANIQQARQLVNDGYSIIIFPEGTRSADGKIHRFHKGAFFLAEQLNLAIQPVFIHGAGYVSPKNELVIKHGPVNVSIQRRIEPTDTRWGETFQERAKRISRYFKSEFEVFRKEMDDTRFMKQRIFNNYIFKGPVLESYFKVKWELEKANYETYDRLIGERKNILDLGCGYGFLSFYLHYRDETRNIVAVDYDEDKIEIAAHSYGKTNRLQFFNHDVTTFHFENQDVIFLNDVLHYLSQEEQQIVLNRCAQQLNSGGMLFIRDGVTDCNEAHQKTRLTEWLSTRFFSFNKKERPFHFFSKADIRALADRHSFSIEELPHSKKTSNMLFILRKPTTN
jgi:1-acyl-sn-glycerol-3-phosphate acyltransferase